MTIRTLLLFATMLFSFYSQAADNISLIKIGDVTLHTFHGISNSHIIETKNELRLVDAQMKLSDARKLKEYIQTLNKPLIQLILSHNHPDHWFGATIFAGETQVVTSANVTSDLKFGGGRYLKILKKKLKDNMPSEVIVPSAELALGSQNWDGLDVIIEEYKDHEAHNSLLIKLPKEGVIIGQDLFYNNMFLVASERSRNQRWIEILENFSSRDAAHYPIILVGHGKNSDASVFQHNIEYLKALETTLAKGLSQKETQQAMIDQFPEKGGKGMLGISMRNLFNAH